MSAPPVLRVVAVDDEPPARDLVRQYLEECRGYELAALAADAFAAVRAIDEHRPEILVLDIQMPKVDGFELLELLPDRPEVIFATAYDEYAIRAFEVEAVDYLLKPFSRERLEEALERARARIEAGEGPDLDRLARRAARARGPLERLLVREGSRVHVIARGEIDYVEARDDYVVIHAGGVGHRKKQTLTELEERLGGEPFVRVHRSYLLNLDRLAGLESYAKDSRVAFLEDGRRLPVSRSGYARLRRHL